MTTLDLSQLNVLITGGTSGFGKAVAKAFAACGSKVFISYYWGSYAEQDILNEFASETLTQPTLIRSDVSKSDQHHELMTKIAAQVPHLDVIVSNVSFAKICHNWTDLSKNALDLSLSYSAWPLVGLLQHCVDAFKAYPKYVLAVSSDGGEVCHPGYALAGASKAVLETFCRYLAVELKSQGVCVNAIRPGFLDTPSSRATFGDEIFEELKDDLLDPNEVAKTCVALCSGLMDSVSGQVITVDSASSIVGVIEKTKKNRETMAG